MPFKPKNFSARGMTTSQVLALQNRLNQKIVRQVAQNIYDSDQKLEKLQRALRQQGVEIGMAGLDMLENMTLSKEWKASYTLQHRSVHCKALRKVLRRLRRDVSEMQIKFEIVHYERNLFRTSRSQSEYQTAFATIEKKTVRTQWEYRDAKTNLWIPFSSDRNDAIEAHYRQAAKGSDYCFVDEHGKPQKLTLKGDSIAIQRDSTVVSMRESLLVNQQTLEKQLVRCHHVEL